MTGKEIAEHVRGWIDSEGFEFAIKDGRIHPSQFPPLEELDTEGQNILHALIAIDRVDNQLEELRKILMDLV